VEHLIARNQQVNVIGHPVDYPRLSRRLKSSRFVALFNSYIDLLFGFTVGTQLLCVKPFHSLDIARRQADLAVRLPRPTESHLVCRKVGTYGFALYASRDDLAKVGAPERGRGLNGHSLIWPDEPPTPYPIWLITHEDYEAPRQDSACLKCDRKAIRTAAWNFAQRAWTWRASAQTRPPFWRSL
jgi:hypothetical protein